MNELSASNLKSQNVIENLKSEDFTVHPSTRIVFQQPINSKDSYIQGPTIHWDSSFVFPNPVVRISSAAENHETKIANSDEAPCVSPPVQFSKDDSSKLNCSGIQDFKILPPLSGLFAHTSDSSLNRSHTVTDINTITTQWLGKKDKHENNTITNTVVQPSLQLMAQNEAYNFHTASNADPLPLKSSSQMQSFNIHNHNQHLYFSLANQDLPPSDNMMETKPHPQIEHTSIIRQSPNERLSTIIELTDSNMNISSPAFVDEMNCIEAVIENEISMPTSSSVKLIKSTSSSSQKITPSSNLKRLKKNRNNIVIPRPSNSFMLYRREKHSEIIKQYQGQKALNNNVISKIVATMWKQESPEVRLKFANLAEEEKRAHMLRHPNYKYQPKKVSKLKPQKPEGAQTVVDSVEAPSKKDTDLKSIPAQHESSHPPAPIEVDVIGKSQSQHQSQQYSSSSQFPLMHPYQTNAPFPVHNNPNTQVPPPVQHTMMPGWTNSYMPFYQHHPMSSRIPYPMTPVDTNMPPPYYFNTYDAQSNNYSLFHHNQLYSNFPPQSTHPIQPTTQHASDGYNV